MTSTEVAPRQRTALSITSDQTEFTPAQVAGLRTLGVKMYDGKRPGGATRADLQIFFHYAARTGLDPFAKQIYLIERMTRDGPRQTIQTGIDGFRLIARRAADTRGQSLGYADTEWCGSDGLWRDVWLSTTPPAAARVAVKRNGEWFPAVALWSEYAQTYKSGGTEHLTPMWARMPASQLAKCAEAAALRKAFPQDLGGLITDDEQQQSDALAEPVDEQPAREPIRRRARPAAASEQQDSPPPPDDVVDADPPRVDDVPMSENQRRMMHALFHEIGITGRDERLQWTRDVIRRDVASSNELTGDEISDLINALQAEAEAYGEQNGSES